MPGYASKIIHANSVYLDSFQPAAGQVTQVEQGDADTGADPGNGGQGGGGDEIGQQPDPEPAEEEPPPQPDPQPNVGPEHACAQYAGGLNAGQPSLEAQLPRASWVALHGDAADTRNLPIHFAEVLIQSISQQGIISASWPYACQGNPAAFPAADCSQGGKITFPKTCVRQILKCGSNNTAPPCPG